MKFGPVEISLRRKDRGVSSGVIGASAPVRSGWPAFIREWNSGSWQRGIEVSNDTALSFHAFYACVTLIAGDVSKLRPKLVEKQPSGIWDEVDSPSFSPVLRKPNAYQNYIQFKEWWTLSKLIHGNAYVLKERDQRQVVTGLYVLDSSRVVPIVTQSGDVYYRLMMDHLSGLQESITVPASEIIHDRMNCFFHPLCGIPPVYASGVAAGQGLSIINDSANFFGNGARPSGVLTAPGVIADETAARLKDHWDAGYTGRNAGKVAVLGDGLKFDALRMNAVDAQLIQQLQYTAAVVCSTFHVPAYMVGVGEMPKHLTVEGMSQLYYSQCLQTHIESMELCLDEGLGIGVGVTVNGRNLGVEMDLEGLLRMDQQTAMTTMVEGVGGGVLAPNEARARMNLKPLPGGNSIYLQQQEYSLEALAKRDANDPFAKPAEAPAVETQANDPASDAAAKEVRALLEKSAADVADLRASIEAERQRHDADAFALKAMASSIKYRELLDV